jgi:hypothetical protein
MRGERIPPVSNLPFTAKVELESVDQLPDGTFISHKTSNLDARDSLGRTRVEVRKWMNQDTDGVPEAWCFCSSTSSGDGCQPHHSLEN